MQNHVFLKQYWASSTYCPKWAWCFTGKVHMTPVPRSFLSQALILQILMRMHNFTHVSSPTDFISDPNERNYSGYSQVQVFVRPRSKCRHDALSKAMKWGKNGSEDESDKKVMQLLWFLMHVSWFFCCTYVLLYASVCKQVTISFLL